MASIVKKENPEGLHCEPRSVVITVCILSIPVIGGHCTCATVHNYCVNNRLCGSLMAVTVPHFRGSPHRRTLKVTESLVQEHESCSVFIGAAW